jgi:hypothetical protein
MEPVVSGWTSGVGAARGHAVADGIEQFTGNIESKISVDKKTILPNCYFLACGIAFGTPCIADKARSERYAASGVVDIRTFHQPIQLPGPSFISQIPLFWTKSQAMLFWQTPSRFGRLLCGSFLLS